MTLPLAFATPLPVWIGFCVAVAVLLVLDMFVFHRKAHEPSLRESAGWTVFWTGLAFLFGVGIWVTTNSEYAIQYFTGYLVEWSLSMDNVFVFLLIFSYFQVPIKYQYRVLFWGILGAIVMRLTFILVAAELLERFEWVMYIFGAFLLFTGIKLFFSHGAEVNPEGNPIIRLARKWLRVTPHIEGDHFFVRHEGKLFVTPLFLVLLVVESTDVVFAVDSVPAIFGVTKIPFIVFSSNVFAIMGLRALYFLLAGVMDKFRFLHFGLAAVLTFIGAKMLMHSFLEDEHGESILPHWASLVVIASFLTISIVASLLIPPKEETEPPTEIEDHGQPAVLPDESAPSEDS